MAEVAAAVLVILAGAKNARWVPLDVVSHPRMTFDIGNVSRQASPVRNCRTPLQTALLNTVKSLSNLGPDDASQIFGQNGDGLDRL